MVCYEYMTEHGYRVGREQTGHIIFSKYARIGDGVLPSLRLMEVMQAQKLPLSRLGEGMTVYSQTLVNVRVQDRKAAQEDPEAQAAVRAAEEALGDSGCVLVRESGTEPLVRAMVEAESQNRCREMAEDVTKVLREKWAG